MRVGRLATALLASTALAGIAPALAGELPSGGSVAFGAVGISTPRPNAMAIKQSSGTAIVNWQSFSIGRDSRVDIAQPSAASTLLNRVGGNTPSTIAGKLNANGQVYLVNPNGIAITKTGVVKAGAFVASTLAISDDDFKAGKRVFKGSGQSAAVTNKGAIEIGRGGYAALIGGKVANAGVVSVPLGKVGLGAGEQATLDLSGDGFLQVAVPSANSAPGALIRQSGRIRADGGRVEIQAATAREAARHAINMSGIVEARSVGGRSGAIVLGGGDGGRVTVSGKLDARGASKLAKGGAITITGNDIRLRSAVLDARGRAGGGTIKIGGDLQGKGDLQRAATTSLDAKTRIRADATRTGDGGEVVVWSDERTTFDGRIAAKGGPQGGDGGKVEVSGKALLEYRGFVNLSARRGDFGTLLLDPYNVFITSGPDARGSLANGVFTPSGPNSVINATTLRTALGAADVTVTTGAAGSPGGQAGDIGVLANVSWSAPTTLTLSAARNITVGSAAGGVISVPSGGDLVLRADNSGTGAGTVAFQGLGRVATAANSTVSILYNPTAVGGGSKYDNAINFAPNVTGSGSLTAFMLVNTVADLQGIDANLGGTYAQGRDIDASSTAAGAGFSPIGLAVASGSAFTGIFDGRNQVIDGLSINRPQLIATGTGLFGTTGPTAVITNVGLTNVSITGGNNVGALVGSNAGTVSNSRADGTVLGVLTQANVTQVAVGGLVGTNTGRIEKSIFDGGTVRGEATSQGTTAIVLAGGVVGQNSGTVTQVFARATVSSNAIGNVGEGQQAPPAIIAQGGVAGVNTGTITRAYSEGTFIAGTLSGGALLARGGLVGANGGNIQESYAAGAVPLDTILDEGTQFVGGLVGTNAAGSTVTRSFWDTTATGRAAGAGQNLGTFAATGLTTPQLQNAAFFVPLAQGQGWNFNSIWAPPGGGFYPELYSISPVVRVVANDRTRLYGSANPALTGQVFGGPSRFVFGPTGDSLPAARLLTTSANVGSNVGNFPILGRATAVSTLGQTYRVIAVGGTLSVTPAPLTIAADFLFKPFGTTLVFTGTEFTTSGLVNGDQITSATLASAGSASDAFFGLYPISIGGAQGTDLANYSVSFVSGALFVGFNPVAGVEATSRTNIVANIPDTGPPFWNPPDEIIIEGGGGSSGGGPTLGTGLGPRTRAAALATLDSIERSSAELERRVAECEGRLDRREITAHGYTSCVADALEAYARDLDRRILELPPQFRGVAATIRQAAARVRAARTVQQARAAVRVAISEVRKAIALLKADEPEVARIQVRTGTTIASALSSVETKLSKAVGL